MDDKKQIILSSIEIARANLYVFRDSKEKEKWELLLNKAEEKINESVDNDVYANNLINRVNDVVSNSWKRIKRWTEFQFKIMSACIIAILLEVLAIALYLYFVSDIVANGFYTSMLFGLLGGTLAVSLSLGKDLEVGGSNRLQTLKLIIRPLVGVIFAIIVYNLLLLNVFTFSEDLNSSSILILMSIFAGYSEKFATNRLANFFDAK
jgi:hypothetical protein